MLAALLPAAVTSAAPSLNIVNLYKLQNPLVNGLPHPDDEPKITRVTSETFDLEVEVQSITNEQIASLYLTVTNVTTGTTDTIRTIQAQRLSDYLVLFNDVPLTEGLNRIVVKLDGDQITESQPGWVYFTPVTNIVDLRINQEPFDEGKFYPRDPGQSTILNITGTANNATEILASLYGSDPVYGFLNQGQFFFIGDDAVGGTPMANLRLSPGDNLITFIARNNTRTFQTTKNLIYDNGKPFAYQLTIRDDANADPQRLILNPTMTKPQITLEGLIKVDLDSLGEYVYRYVTLKVPGQVLEADLYDLANAEFPLLSVERNADYEIFKFQYTFTAGVDRLQTIDFVFESTVISTDVVNSFFFYFEDPTAPYIQYVEWESAAGGIVRLSEASRTEINEQPVHFYVYANENTAKVKYAVGSWIEDTVDDFEEDNATGLRVFEIRDVQGIPVGNATIVFTPIDGDDDENPSGAKSFELMVSSAPYVIFHNLYNGLVLNNLNELRTISGRFVNVANLNQIVFYVNNRLIDLDNSDFLNNDFGTRTLQLDLQANGVTLQQGSNSVRVLIYEDAARTRLAVDTIVTFFLFSMAAPEFISVEPVEPPGEDLYRETNIPWTFVTNERSVRIVGRFANVTNNNDVTATIVRAPDNTAQNLPMTVNAAAGTFDTGPVNLADVGDTIFTFSLTNATGIIVTRTVTIVREPLPYEIIYPKFRVNANGVLEANVNSNFVEFDIRAEHADAVLFGNTAAVEKEANHPVTLAPETRFFHEVTNLKRGRNNIEFTVVRGEERLTARVIVNYVATAEQGAMYKTKISNRIRVFDDQLELTFPRNTTLRINDKSAVDPYITSDRMILFGIADNYDGRVDKYKHPAPYDMQLNNPNPLISSVGRLRLTLPSRVKPISPLYWIDAGVIRETDSLKEKLEGSGKLPYDAPEFHMRDPDELVVPSQPGTLTLKYDPSVRRDAWKYVTVFHYDYYEDYRGVSEWRWRNIGGVVNPNNNTITVPLERFGYYQVMYMYQSFDDIISHPWARDYLDILFSKGIMLNKTGINFVPNDPITRGEFVTLLVKIFEFPLKYTETPTFTDVLRVNPLTNGLYDYMHIETAAAAGIIRGQGGGRFQPDAPITRQDAAVMIARAANLRLNNDEERVLRDLQRRFTDANGIEIYARASVLAVVNEGLMEGRQNILLPGERETFRFDPLATFTRAEAAVVAYRVMLDQKKIPR